MAEQAFNFAEIPVTVSMRTVEELEQMLKDMRALVEFAKPLANTVERSKARTRALQLAGTGLELAGTLQPAGVQSMLAKQRDSIGWALKMESYAFPIEGPS